MGVETKPITKQVARQMDLPGGALITKVHLDGPSNEYLIPGDLIVSVNGNPTQQPDDLLRMLAPVTPGVQVEIGFMRQKTGRQPKSVPIVLAEMPGKALGLFLASNEESGNRRRTREVGNGVPILEVDPGSEAANQGLAPGDVITAIGSTPVTTSSCRGKFRRAGRTGARSFWTFRSRRQASAVWHSGLCRYQSRRTSPSPRFCRDGASLCPIAQSGRLPRGSSASGEVCGSHEGTPTCAVAFQLSANMHRALGRYEVAERLYREALEIFEKVPDSCSISASFCIAWDRTMKSRATTGGGEVFEQALRALAKDPTAPTKMLSGTLGPLARVYRHRDGIGKRSSFSGTRVRRKAMGTTTRTSAPLVLFGQFIRRATTLPGGGKILEGGAEEQREAVAKRPRYCHHVS